MEIGIDCSCVAKAERTGVARYCVSLLRALPAVLDEEDRVTLLYRISRVKRFRHFERVADPRFSLTVFHDGAVRRLPSGLEVVHGPDLRIPRTPLPTVSTVHDLSALQHPEIARASFREKKRAVLTDVAERADVILCISDYTERILLERFPAAEGRTRVVPLGLSDRFQPQTPERIATMREALGIGERYLLFVGQISKRKNLLPLLEAFSRLALDPENRDVQLVLAGPVQTGGAEIVATAEASAAADRIRFPGFVADEHLPPLYGGAQAFCFTSKAEGFGLPILEAMACGCPVVATRAGASASTAGGAARLVDPDSAEELCGVLRELLQPGEARRDLIERGHARAEEFSWRETARKTVAAYRDAIEVHG